MGDTADLPIRIPKLLLGNLNEKAKGSKIKGLIMPEAGPVDLERQ